MTCKKFETEDSGSTTKKPFPIIIVFCTVLVLSLILNVALIFVQKNSSVIEGKGFSSPEAAITAYAKALRKGDVDEMVSTFAIESYVDHYDLDEHMSVYGYYQFNNAEVALPNDSDYKTKLNCYSRTGYVTQQILNTYFTLTGVDNSKSLLAFPRDTKETEIDAFLQQLEYPIDKKLSRIKLGDVLTEDDFPANNGYSRQLASYSHLDADELCDVAIEFEFDGQQYYLFMLTVKIDGKWYNVTPVSPLGIVNGLDSTSGGLMIQ